MKRTYYYFSFILFLPNIVAGQDLPFMDATFTNEQKGDHFFDQKAYTRAEKSYMKALEHSPEDLTIQLKLARCNAYLNDPEETSNYYAKSITAAQTTDGDLLRFAESLSALGRYQEAERWYTRYRENHKDETRALARQEGIDKIDQFFLDSIAYLVKPADFNTTSSEFGPVFMNDRLIFVSDRNLKGAFQPVDGRNEGAFLEMYQLKDGTVSSYKEFDNRLNIGPITFFDHASRAIVTASRSEVKGNKDRSKPVNLKLEIYQKTTTGWEYEMDFPYNNPEYSVGHPSFDVNKEILYFASNKPGGKGGVDLYTSEYRKGEWSEPKNLEQVNTEGDEVFPFIMPSQELYFASTGYGGLGGLDLYKIHLSNIRSVPYNLGYPVNTSQDDFSLVLDESGKKGYFSSNRDLGEGADDIYEVTIFIIRVESGIVDELTGELVDGEVSVLDKRTGASVFFEREDKKIVFEAVKGRPYLIQVEKEGYVSNSFEFIANTDQPSQVLNIPVKRTSDVAEEGLITIRLDNLSGVRYYQIKRDEVYEIDSLAGTSGDSVMVVGNLYFGFDSDEILKGKEVLAKWVQLMQANPSIRLEIRAHCDAIGTEAYNDQLAERRANKVLDYLVGQGIEKERMTTAYSGERNPLHPCELPQNCSKEVHRQHRRVEFFLLKAQLKMQ